MKKIDYLNKFMSKYNYNLKTNRYNSNKVTIFITNHTCIREKIKLYLPQVVIVYIKKEKKKK